MARAIDADNVLERIENIAQHWQKHGKKYEAMLVPSVVKSIIDSVPTITPSSEWVSVEDRLPDTAGEFLVVYHPCYGDKVTSEIRVGIDSFRGKTAWAKRKYQRVTHWMPLPKPPKEELKDDSTTD